MAAINEETISGWLDIGKQAGDIYQQWDTYKNKTKEPSPVDVEAGVGEGQKEPLISKPIKMAFIGIVVIIVIGVIIKQTKK